MRLLFALTMLALFPLSGFAADAPVNERERLKRIADAVAARRVIREHENGTKPATEAELAAAREVLRKLDGSQAKKSTDSPPGRITVKMPDGDMKTLATSWKALFGESVTVVDRIKTRTVSISLAEPSLAGLRQKFEAELRRQGIYLVVRADGKCFDSEPDKNPSPGR